MKNILELDTRGAFCRHTHAEATGAANGPLAGPFGLSLVAARGNDTLLLAAARRISA